MNAASSLRPPSPSRQSSQLSSELKSSRNCFSFMSNPFKSTYIPMSRPLTPSAQPYSTKTISDFIESSLSSAENLAEAYDTSRQFLNLSPTDQGKLKTLLSVLSKFQATPFLIVSAENILFSNGENPNLSFRFAKISDIPPLLNEGTLSSLGKPLNQPTTDTLTSKLTFKLPRSHSICIDSEGFNISEDFNIKVYPYQNSTTKTKVVTLPFLNSDTVMDTSQFSESLSTEIKELKLDFSSRNIQKANRIMFTVNLQSSESSNTLLKRLLSVVANVLMAYNGITCGDIKLFDNDFYQILNPTNYDSKKQLFDSIGYSDFFHTAENSTPLCLSGKLKDLSYPRAIWLEKPSEHLLNLLKDVTGAMLYYKDPEIVVLFSEKFDPSLLDVVSKDAINFNYKYSMAIK